MSKVFVIPDVHLKPWIFDKAQDLIEKGDYDKIVLLGDFVDDWNQEKNLDLYKETFDKIFEFLGRYPDTLYCFGNHDLSYLFQAFETGYSSYARDIVVEGVNKIIYSLPSENSAYIHRIENVIFSHAGLTEKFVRRCFGSGGILDIDQLLEHINGLGKDKIWRDDSPIWARPQLDNSRIYPMGMMQVVGHTPVEHPQLDSNGKLLTLDTFSTHYDGKPIGDQKFVCVDTLTEDWFIVNE
ncbi:MAG: metallophosphoesterase [Eubacterium sp.]|nr:metallophosphoesterase [Eubacterium sp.]